MYIHLSIIPQRFEGMTINISREISFSNPTWDEKKKTFLIMRLRIENNTITKKCYDLTTSKIKKKM